MNLDNICLNYFNFTILKFLWYLNDNFNKHQLHYLFIIEI